MYVFINCGATNVYVDNMQHQSTVIFLFSMTNVWTRFEMLYMSTYVHVKFDRICGMQHMYAHIHVEKRLALPGS